MLTPMSEWRTSWTFCWIWGSGESCFCSCAGAKGVDEYSSAGGGGAASSTRAAPAPLVVVLAPKELLKSGWKLSVLSMGGSVGGAAMAGGREVGIDRFAERSLGRKAGGLTAIDATWKARPHCGRSGHGRAGFDVACNCPPLSIRLDWTRYIHASNQSSRSTKFRIAILSASYNPELCTQP